MSPRLTNILSTAQRNASVSVATDGTWTGRFGITESNGRRMQHGEYRLQNGALQVTGDEKHRPRRLSTTRPR